MMLTAEAAKFKFQNGQVNYVVHCPNCGEESFQYCGLDLVPKKEECGTCDETFKVIPEEDEDDDE